MVSVLLCFLGDLRILGTSFVTVGIPMELSGLINYERASTCHWIPPQIRTSLVSVNTVNIVTILG